MVEEVARAVREGAVQMHSLKEAHMNVAPTVAAWDTRISQAQSVQDLPLQARAWAQNLGKEDPKEAERKEEDSITR